LIRLYCATGNPGKLREFRLAAAAPDVSGPHGADVGAGHARPATPKRPAVEIELLPDFRALPPAIEDGATFEENAAKKALHYARYASGPLFADDSGLEVDALGGAPGVYSARFSGPQATDESNNRLLLEKLQGVSGRAARFTCAIALAEAGAIRGIWRASVEGRILEAPRGSGGFGYDPLFYYEPFACTFSEVEGERKFAVSHRGQALRAMLQSLL
jgi:XTP/dITP diphosphohydrolase